MTRPYLDIEADEVEFQDWTQEEKNADPNVANRNQKIVLWFYVHGASDIPAANVDINATSELLVEKHVGNLVPGQWNCPYEHNLHTITNPTSRIRGVEPPWRGRNGCFWAKVSTTSSAAFERVRP